MARYRQVYCEFWKDPRVSEEMTPEDRYFMLYLLTNMYASQIGVYEISKKTMAFELGYTTEAVNAIMERFEHHHKLIQYNAQTREIAIKNWGRYNFFKGGKPICDLIRSELKMVKDQALVSWVYHSYLETSGQFKEINESICSIFEDYLGIAGFDIDLAGRCVDDACHDTSTLCGQDIDVDIDKELESLKPIVHECDENLQGNMSLKAEAEALFEELWQLYPHKKGKGQVKASQKADLFKTGKVAMIQAIERYIAYVEGQRRGGFNLQYQNGSTFFHSGFRDYIGDDYVDAPVRVKPADTGGGAGASKNKFHNFQHSKQQYSDKELELKLRGKIGGVIGVGRGA